MKCTVRLAEVPLNCNVARNNEPASKRRGARQAVFINMKDLHVSFHQACEELGLLSRIA